MLLLDITIVVAPQDAGMASGINTTFRQVGIATSIAALGSIFATKMADATPGPGWPVQEVATG